MKKDAIIVLATLISVGILLSPLSAAAAAVDSKNDVFGEGADEAYQQTILEFLLPQIDQDVQHYYKEYFNLLPGVAPYYGGKVLGIQYHQFEPVNRSYSYEVAVQVMPYFGPHVVVGRDNLTYRVFPRGKVRLDKYEHIESYEIPPHYRDTIINKWPPEK